MFIHVEFIGQVNFTSPTEAIWHRMTWKDENELSVREASKEAFVDCFKEASRHSPA